MTSPVSEEIYVEELIIITEFLSREQDGWMLQDFGYKCLRCEVLRSPNSPLIPRLTLYTQHVKQPSSEHTRPRSLELERYGGELTLSRSDISITSRVDLTIILVS